MNRKDMVFLKLSFIGLLVIDIIIFGVIFYISEDYNSKYRMLKDEYIELKLEIENTTY